MFVAKDKRINQSATKKASVYPRAKGLENNSKKKLFEHANGWNIFLFQ